MSQKNVSFPFAPGTEFDILIAIRAGWHTARNNDESRWELLTNEDNVVAAIEDVSLEPGMFTPAYLVEGNPQLWQAVYPFTRNLAAAFKLPHPQAQITVTQVSPESYQVVFRGLQHPDILNRSNGFPHVAVPSGWNGQVVTQSPLGGIAFAFCAAWWQMLDQIEADKPKILKLR